MPAKDPKVKWSQRRATLAVTVTCSGATGEPQLKKCSGASITVKWAPYELSGKLAKPVDAATAEWSRSGASLTLRATKAACGAHWPALFLGEKRSYVGRDLDDWMEEDEEQAEIEEASAKAAAKASAKAGPSIMTKEEALPYRVTTGAGWRPLAKDWQRIVERLKPLTDDLNGRKIALSFSNVAADAKFARELSACLVAEGCEVRSLVKWPASAWADACVYAADAADFTLILHSPSYDTGKMTTAERWLIKEANCPYLQLELGDESHPFHAADAASAVLLLRRSLVIDQRGRVETNTAPCTLTWSALEAADRAAYSKLLKVWTPKPDAQRQTSAFMTQEVGADETWEEHVEKQKRAAAARKLDDSPPAPAAPAPAHTPPPAIQPRPAAAPSSPPRAQAASIADEAAEVQELQRMLASGAASVRRRSPDVAREVAPSTAAVDVN